MRQAPALKAAIGFAIGIFISFWVPHSALSLITSSFLFILACFTFRLYNISNLTIYALLIASGWFAGLAALPPEITKSSLVQIRCVVTEPPVTHRNAAAFPARLTRLEGRDIAHFPTRSIWVYGRMPDNLLTGDEIEIAGVLAPSLEARNPGAPDIKRFRRAAGMIGELRAVENPAPKIIGRRSSPMLKARLHLNTLCDSLGRWDAPLWKGLLFGFRRDIDPTMTEELRVTGLTHLLALSGLNVGFLAGLFFGLSKLLPVTPAKRAVPALALVILYTMIIPDRGATVRASLMVSTALISLILRRWTPVSNTIGLAALLALAYRPLELFDVGFQMSFAATSSIFLFQADYSEIGKRLNRMGRWPRRLNHLVVAPLFISLAASAAVAPFMASSLLMVPLAGPLYNLWAVPLMGMIYGGIWTSVLLYHLHQGLAYLLADGALALGALNRALLHYSAQFAPVWEGFLPPVAAGIFCLILVWTALSRRNARARYSIAVLAIAFLFLAGAGPTRFNSTEIWFFDVGHGDAAIWRLDDDAVAVIDGGPKSALPARNAALQALRRFNVKRVSLLTASHLEADHIGGLIDIANSYPVDAALLGGGRDTASLPRELIRCLEAQGTPVYRPEGWNNVGGLPAGCLLQVFGPPLKRIELSVNNRSLTLKLTDLRTGGKGSILLSPGDIERVGEELLAGSGDIHAGLLKVPHHGSPTSSTPSFLIAVQPSDAVFTRSSLFESGSREGRLSIFNRYREAGTAIHRTDREGAILFVAVKEGWQKRDWRRQSFWNWLLGEFG